MWRFLFWNLSIFLKINSLSQYKKIKASFFLNMLFSFLSSCMYIVGVSEAILLGYRMKIWKLTIYDISSYWARRNRQDFSSIIYKWTLFKMDSEGKIRFQLKALEKHASSINWFVESIIIKQALWFFFIN